MTLCETHQAVPDFLEEYLPSGFTADGQGDVGTLHFDADSDNGEGEGEVTENADAGDGWVSLYISFFPIY
jgi:ATP-dependent RNA helicase DDX3X